jgi:hypothetical protein
MTGRDLRERIEFDLGENEKLVNFGSFTDPSVVRTDFSDLHVAVSDLGARFWGLDLRTSDGYMSHADGVQPRLRVLKKILAVMPVPETESDQKPDTEDTKPKPIDWLSVPVSDLPKISDRNKGLVIRDVLSDKPTKPSLHKKFPNAPKTYADAHHDAAIRMQAANALKHIGDPAYEIVRSLEGWRYIFDNDDISRRSLELGRNTFNVFMFSVGSDNYMRALGTAASWQHRIDQKSL